MKAISILFMVLGCILILPALTLFVDIWTWIMFGGGITPVDWTSTTPGGTVDKVAKPIMAIMSSILSGPIFLISIQMYPTERHDCI